MNRLEREIAAQRAALLRVERNGASKIASAYVAVERRLKRNVALLMREIERARSNGIEVKPGWLFAQQRYAVLIEELQQSLLGFLHRSVAAAVKAQGEAVARAPRDAEALIFAAIGPAPEAALRSLRSTFGAFPAAQFEHLIGRASNGQPLGDLLGEIVPASTEAVRNSLAYGVAAGLSPRVVAQDIQIRSGMARTRALAIARTEMLGAYRTVTSERFRTSNVVLSWTWVAMLDQRTCPACLSMNGTVHPMDEGLDSHPNCRCVQAPRTSSWSELGFTGIPDTRPQFPSAEQAFSKLPEAKQLAILGQARLDAYNAGLISMEDLVRETRSTRWGTGRRAATLTELGLHV